MPEFDVSSVSWHRAEYIKQLPIWSKVRDAASGEEAIKAKTTAYLPRLGGHTSDGTGNALYDIYLDYAHWYGATARTLAGLRGLVFRKDPLKRIPDKLKFYEENITADGQSLMSFTKDVLMEVLQTNRCGIFIDFPHTELRADYSKLDAELENIRPYVRMYRAENIINWRTDTVNNETVTTLVVLTETVEEADAGGFALKRIQQYRVLYLDELGVYHQRLYRMAEANAAASIIGGMTEIEDVVPLVNNKHLYSIPFFPITDKGITWDISNPTILPLVNTNISHYKNSANREQALIWTGNPTPVFSGYAGEAGEGEIRLGSTEAILLMNGGTAQFLEFTGQGINPIKEAMAEKEEEMAVLGARIIAPEKRTAETAESAAIHRAGEQGVLADIANSISDGLTRVLRFFGAYHGETNTDDIWIKLNTDFLPAPINHQMLTALGKLYTGNLISWKTYIYQLQQGEILPLGTTEDDEEASILADIKRKEKINPPKVEEEIAPAEEEETVEEDVSAQENM